MTDDTIVDAEIVPQRASDETVIQVHLRELPRKAVHQCCTFCRPPDSHCHSHEAMPLPLDDAEPLLPAVIGGWTGLDKALAFHRLQEEENAKSSRPFDWFDWLRSLLAAQGRKDVDGFRDLIAIGEKRGFFA